MPAKLHTPYDGSGKPFTIGLRALPPEHWIEVDERLGEQVVEKQRLLAERHDEVFRAEADTIGAQQEVLAALLEYLPRRYTDLYQVTGKSVTIVPAGMTYAIEEFAARPLELASRLIQDDLVLMRPSDVGHRLVAAVLCFPSSWSLREKFGKAMVDVHGPVPGFGAGSRNARLIERIFTNLQPNQPVERLNWSIYDAPDLYYPQREHAGEVLVGKDGQINGWLRVERQTLSKLPVSGDVLFTIKICVDPIDVLRRHPDGASLASSLKSQIEELDADQLAYKGMAQIAQDLIAALEDIHRMRANG